MGIDRHDVRAGGDMLADFNMLFITHCIVTAISIATFLWNSSG